MMRSLRLFLRRRRDRCPPEWILTQHLSGELTDPEVEGHIERCPRCASECASLRRVVTQAQGLAVPAEMSADVRRAIGARLLATAPVPRPWRGWPVVAWGVPAVALLVAAGVWGTRGTWRAATPVASSEPSDGFRTSRDALGPAELDLPRRASSSEPSDGFRTSRESSSAQPVVGGPVAPRSRAAVRAVGAARCTRVQGPPDDVLRLDDGTIVLEVAPLPSGERFRVTTDDAEVEVRGTRFQVTASRGKLTQVTVASGRVEVRSAGGGRVVLDPGDEWVSGATSKETREAEATGPPIARPVRSRPARGAAESGPVAPAPAPAIPPQTQRASFDRAWSVLRQGDAGRAAALFGEVERASGDSDIAEDAHYWRAVATARAGDRPTARALFESFLVLFPASSRTGAAAAALGWLYFENAQNDKARHAFERAMGDPSPEVRASARAGLRRASHP
jgi:TolA-binding protein